MTVELVTGYSGTAHVSSSEDGARQAGTVGTGMYVLETVDDPLAATLENAQTVTVGPGDLMINGRHVQLTGSTTYSVPVGVQGQQTSNILAVRYSVDDSGVEKAEPVTLTGSPAPSDPPDPTLYEGSILDGDSPIDMPLYRVVTTGIETAEPVKLFETVPTVAELSSPGGITGEMLASDSVTADKIASGAVGTSEIKDDAVTAAKIATNAVTADGIAAGAVGSSELASNAVQTAKIAANAVTSDKLAQAVRDSISRVTLYSNSSGSYGTIALSQSAANFSIIDIAFKTNDGESGCVRVHDPNGKNVTLFHNKPRDTTKFILKMRTVNISGTKIAETTLSGYVVKGSYLVDIYGYTENEYINENGIAIVKVVGYK